MDKVKLFVGGIVGTFFSFFGILAIPLALLIPCNIIDYFTGMAAAKSRGEKISSNVGFKGILKKVSMYILIFVGFGMDVMINYAIKVLGIQFELPMLFAAIVTSWLVINELISITENCEEIGQYIPILSPVLKFVRKKIESKVEIKGDD